MRRAKIKVSLVGSHPVVLEGIRSALETGTEIKIVGQSLGFETSMAMIKRSKPDVVMVECNADPDETCVELAKIRKMFPQMREILFCNELDRKFVIEAVRVGIDGFLIKGARKKEMIHAVEIVAEGNAYFSPEACSVLAAAIRAGTTTPRATLSARETEILKFVANGLTSKQISQKLGIGIRTVHSHREHIKAKLGIKAVADLTKYALSKGIV